MGPRPERTCANDRGSRVVARTEKVALERRGSGVRLLAPTLDRLRPAGRGAGVAILGPGRKQPRRPRRPRRSTTSSATCLTACLRRRGTARDCTESPPSPVSSHPRSSRLDGPHWGARSAREIGGPYSKRPNGANTAPADYWYWTDQIGPAIIRSVLDPPVVPDGPKGDRPASRYEGFASVVESLHRLVAEHARLGHARIPGERALSTRLGIGRQQVREALRALEAVGLVNSRRNSGWYVEEREVSPSPEALAAGKSSIVSREGLLSFLSFRLLIEPGLAGWAARNADEGDFERLNRAIENDPFGSSVGAALGAEFHAAIVIASKNTHAISACNSSDLFIFWTGVTLRLKARDSIEAHDREHRSILKAITEMNEDLAADLTAKHIRRSIALIRSDGTVNALYDDALPEARKE
jgi:GntR family transcriptional repressor for pyruvate dehydrogenase complex